MLYFPLKLFYKYSSSHYYYVDHNTLLFYFLKNSLTKHKYLSENLYKSRKMRKADPTCSI